MWEGSCGTRLLPSGPGMLLSPGPAWKGKGWLLPWRCHPFPLEMKGCGLLQATLKNQVWMCRERSLQMTQYMEITDRVHEHSLVMNQIQARPRRMCFFETLFSGARNCASCKKSQHSCPLHWAIRADLLIYTETISNLVPRALKNFFYSLILHSDGVHGGILLVFIAHC